MARLHVALPERRLVHPRNHQHRLLRHLLRVETERALTEKQVLQYSRVLFDVPNVVDQTALQAPQYVSIKEP